MSIPAQDANKWAYKQYRAEVFKRDGYRCVYCESTMRLALDHVIPRSRGGSNDPSNLVTCCEPCNGEKSDLTPEEWLALDLLNPALSLPNDFFTPPPTKSCINHPKGSEVLSFEPWHMEVCEWNKHRAFVLSVLVNWKGKYAPTIWEVEDSLLGGASSKTLKAAIEWLETKGIVSTRGKRSGLRLLLDNKSLIEALKAKGLWQTEGE